MNRIRKIETLGNFDLNVLYGWLPIHEFCKLMPYTKEKVKNFRNTGKWLDGVVTKCVGREIWVNVWEVQLYNQRNGLV